MVKILKAASIFGLVWTLTLLPTISYAGVFELNTIYSSDSLKLSSESKSSLLAYDFLLGISLGRSNMYVGLNYGAFTSASEGTTAVKYNGSDLGIKFGSFFGRGRLFSSSLTYNIKSTVKLDDNGTESELRGTSLSSISECTTGFLKLHL